MTLDDAVIRTRRAYEASAAAWASRGFDHFRIDPYIQRFVEMVEMTKAGRRVLDLGCGPGFHCGSLRACDLEAIGLDVTIAMLRIARSRLGLASALVQGDARHLPIRDASVAGVWASASLLHLPKADVGRALSEGSRVLVTGGVFMTMMKQGDQDAFDRPPAGSTVEAPRYFAHYRREEWTRLLADAGFAVETQETNADSRPGYPDWITTYARKG